MKPESYTEGTYRPDEQTLARLRQETAKREGYVIFNEPLVIRARFTDGTERDYTAIARNADKWVIVMKDMPNSAVGLADSLVVNKDVTGVIAALAAKGTQKVHSLLTGAEKPIIRKANSAQIHELIFGNTPYPLRGEDGKLYPIRITGAANGRFRLQFMVNGKPEIGAHSCAEEDLSVCIVPGKGIESFQVKDIQYPNTAA